MMMIIFYETECVYSAVRTGSYVKCRFILDFKMSNKSV